MVLKRAGEAQGRDAEIARKGGCVWAEHTGAMENGGKTGQSAIMEATPFLLIRVNIEKKRKWPLMVRV